MGKHEVDTKVCYRGTCYEVSGTIEFVQHSGATTGQWQWDDYSPRITPDIDDDNDELFNAVQETALDDFLVMHPEVAK